MLDNIHTQCYPCSISLNIIFSYLVIGKAAFMRPI
jgi:hypothetical protein